MLGGVRNMLPSPSRVNGALNIGFATSVYGEVASGWDVTLDCPADPDVSRQSTLRVTFSSEARRSSGFDALIFYGPDLAHSIRTKASFLTRYRPPLLLSSRNVNVYFSEEPPYSSLMNEASPIELDPNMMDKFSVYAGFHPGQLLSHQGHVCYSGWGLRHWATDTIGDRNWSAAWRQPLAYSQRDSEYEAVWVQSNCAEPNHLGNAGPSPRVPIVKALMRRLKIASFGQCLHNRDFPGNLSKFSGFGNELAQIQDAYLRKFKFAIALENNVCDFYMSEKIWKAFALGLIPVIFGSPIVSTVLPSSDSYIDLRDFRSVAELAAYMKKVAENEDQFNTFFEWRTRPLSSLSVGFQDLWRSAWRSKDEFKCCIARGVANSLRMKRQKLSIPGLNCQGYNWSSLKLDTH